MTRRAHYTNAKSQSSKLVSFVWCRTEACSGPPVLSTNCMSVEWWSSFGEEVRGVATHQIYRTCL